MDEDTILQRSGSEQLINRQLVLNFTHLDHMQFLQMARKQMYIMIIMETVIFQLVVE